MTVRTRFAPSPTGYLHIGGARTALFNYLFAKKHGGRFLLRIEDTDKARTTDAGIQAILNSMQWLDLMPDEDIVYQSKQINRHVKIAKQLLEDGKAYYCYTAQKEIIEMRQEAKARGEHFIFRSKWRNIPIDRHPKDIKPVIRLKSPMSGETLVNDLLQGKIVVQNSHLDDMILLRSDGTPTYMLAVVVDDHDMGITHVIRGDDHLNNASRQQLIYEALGCNMPKMVHIPLIHGADGVKLSKRHGALGTDSYKDMGYLPEALNNYLLRLGWSHVDDEIISRTDAIKWFGIEGMGKSSSMIGLDKMKHMNAIYLRQTDNDVLSNIVFNNLGYEISDESKKNISLAMDSLKIRAELTTDLCDLAIMFIIDKPIKRTEEAKNFIKECDKNLIEEVIESLKSISDFKKDKIQFVLKKIALKNNLKLGRLMKYVRAFITGMTGSSSVFEMIEILGIVRSIERLQG